MLGEKLADIKSIGGVCSWFESLTTEDDVETKPTSIEIEINGVKFTSVTGPPGSVILISKPDRDAWKEETSHSVCGWLQHKKNFLMFKEFFENGTLPRAHSEVPWIASYLRDPVIVAKLEELIEVF